MYSIYFLTDDTEFIKVGISVNVKQRLKQTQTHCPRELRILFQHKTPLAKVYEKALLQFYKSDAAHGEWLHLNNKDLQEWIDHIRKGDLLQHFNSVLDWIKENEAMNYDVNLHQWIKSKLNDERGVLNFKHAYKSIPV